MNVLLAEADVPYELLREMDDINPEFSRADAGFRAINSVSPKRPRPRFRW